MSAHKQSFAVKSSSRHGNRRRLRRGSSPPWPSCWRRRERKPPSTSWLRPAATPTRGRWRRRSPPFKRVTTWPSPATRSGCARAPTRTRGRSSCRGAGRPTACASSSGRTRARIRSWIARLTPRPTKRPTCRASRSPATGCTCAGSRLPMGRSAPAATTRSRMLRSDGASNNTFELLNIHHGFGPGPVHRQWNRRQPDPQLRLARQLRQERQPGRRPERRRLRRPLPDDRAEHDHPRLPRVVELRRRLRPDLAGGPGHCRELAGRS